MNNKPLKIFSRLKNYLLIVSSLLLISTNAGAQKNLNNLETKITSLVDSLYVKYSVPGVIVGIWTPEFTYKHVIGKADLKTGQERKFDDKIRIASITKTFVATVLLQLVDEGRMLLDDRLDKYFPSYPDASNITIRQMLDMTSGIPDYFSDPVIQNSSIYDRFDQYTPEQIYDIIASMKPSFAPGTSFQYSNANYHLLGMIIEKITGNKVGNEIDNRIIKSLGLTNTTFPVSPEMSGQYSHGYMKDTLTGEFIDVTPNDPSIGWAAGSMVSNLDDLKIYVLALANGTMISKSSQDERLKFVNTSADFMKYGLGIFSFGGYLGHNGGIAGYNTTMGYNPDLNTVLIVSVNELGFSEGASDRIFMRVANVISPGEKIFPE